MLYVRRAAVARKCCCEVRLMMRPGLPEWWDGPPLTKPQPESMLDVAERVMAQNQIVEPVMAHIRELFLPGGLEIEETEPNMKQWKWAIAWDVSRKAIAEGLLNTQSAEHEAWLTVINPALGPEPLSEEDKARRGQAFRDFRSNASSRTFLKAMKQEVFDLLLRISNPGYADGADFY